MRRQYISALTTINAISSGKPLAAKKNEYEREAKYVCP